jgi:hypothetical protein
MHRAILERFASDVIIRALGAAYEGSVAHGPAPDNGPARPRANRPIGPAQIVPASPLDAGARLDPGAPPILIGFRRGPGLDRIARLPSELASALTLVTSQAHDAGREEATLATVVIADGEGLYEQLVRSGGGPLAPAPLMRRLARAVRHPARAFRLRRLQRRRAAIVNAERRRVVSNAVRSAAAATVLPLDFDDLDALPGTPSGSTVLAPGPLPWLADAWDGERSSADRVLEA